MDERQLEKWRAEQSAAQAGRFWGSQRIDRPPPNVYCPRGRLEPDPQLVGQWPIETFNAAAQAQKPGWARLLTKLTKLFAYRLPKLTLPLITNNKRKVEPMSELIKDNRTAVEPLPEPKRELAIEEREGLLHIKIRGREFVATEQMLAQGQFAPIDNIEGLRRYFDGRLNRWPDGHWTWLDGEKEERVKLVTVGDHSHFKERRQVIRNERVVTQIGGINPGEHVSYMPCYRNLRGENHLARQFKDHTFQAPKSFAPCPTRTKISFETPERQRPSTELRNTKKIRKCYVPYFAKCYPTLAAAAGQPLKAVSSVTGAAPQ